MGFKPIWQTFITASFLLLLIYIFIFIYLTSKVYKDNATKSDAIIVLGAKSYVNGRVNECVKARVEHAANLYIKGYADKIIMSGGTDKKPVPQNTNEAEEMKKIALSLDLNIEPSDILIEGESTSTYENLLFSKDLMQANGLGSAIIVTEPFHSPRADLVAKNLDIPHTLSPTLTSPCWNRFKYISRYFLREPIAIFAYKFLGQI